MIEAVAFRAPFGEIIRRGDAAAMTTCALVAIAVGRIMTVGTAGGVHPVVDRRLPFIDYVFLGYL
jgi:hypothetical protein